MGRAATAAFPTPPEPADGLVDGEPGELSSDDALGGGGKFGDPAGIEADEGRMSEP